MTSDWADIPGYEGLYQASKTGQIRRVDSGLILTPIKHSRGYLHVHLSHGSRESCKKLLVHRLVAAAFLGEQDAVVNHKDGNKYNNCLENLEWCTQGANVQHYFKMRSRREDRRQIREHQNDPIDF
jgi:hypothetical protein